jgi:hypothetical protein
MMLTAAESQALQAMTLRKPLLLILVEATATEGVVMQAEIPLINRLSTSAEALIA